MSTLETVRFKQLLCSICLDLFTDPVSTPCGHNFCKSCITQAWKTSAPCRCPLCKAVYNIKPVLKVNTLLSEMASEFKQEAENRSKQVSKPEVLCDDCTDPKLKAVKSCLVCLASYCDTHLQPHLTVSGLKKHQLMEPVENLEDRMCPKHNKPLELFCCTDETCICIMCHLLEHKNHEIVSLKEEFNRKKSSLQQTQAQTKRMMDQRHKKKQEFRQAFGLIQNAAEKEKTTGLHVFTALEESLQRRKEQFIEELQEKQRKNEKQAQDLIQELEREISALEKRSSEVEQLSRSEDHLHFLQSSTSLRPAAALKDWSTISFEPCKIFKGTTTRALAELEQNLSEEFKKAFGTDLKRLQQFAVDITLDADTAHPKIVLSDDMKQVYGGDEWKDLSDNPQRFDKCVCVLGKQSFSSGRFYFEVQVKGKTKWTLGVVQESSSKKGKITVIPEKGYWCIWLRNSNEYKACTDPPVRLSPRCPPQKVGLFVDYSEGVVSFYNVNTADLIYSFTGCRFTGNLFPFFDPCNNERGVNSAPLVITKI